MLEEQHCEDTYDTAILDVFPNYSLMGETESYLTIYKSNCDKCYKSGLKNTTGG